MPEVGKAELRRTLLQVRQSMLVEEWREKSDRMCERLQSSPLFARSRTILAYFSFRQEPDLSRLFANTQHRWGFPRCVGKSLSWHTWKPGDSLSTGDYGIFEPHPDTPILQPTEVDLILVPAVACDVQGTRLGYGGGFYDRMLSFAEWESKLAIAIVFEFAFLPQLPVDSWDKPLHGVCTEIGLRMTRSHPLTSNL